MSVHDSARQTLTCIPLLVASLGVSCTALHQRGGTDITQEAARALFVHLMEEKPPINGTACITLAVGPNRTGHALDTGPTLELLRARGIRAVDGSECAVNRRVPEPTDTGPASLPYGVIIHTGSGHRAATYSVRVLEISDRRATLHGGYTYTTTYGATCSYEACLEAGRWVVRLLTTEPCTVA